MQAPKRPSGFRQFDSLIRKLAAVSPEELKAEQKKYAAAKVQRQKKRAKRKSSD